MSLVLHSPAAAKSAVAQSQEPDTIRLKNGSVIRGRVVGFKEREFTIVMPGTKSRAIVHVDDVESVEFGEEVKSEPPVRRDEPASKPTTQPTPPPTRSEPTQPTPTPRTEPPEKTEKPVKTEPPPTSTKEPPAGTTPLPKYVETPVKVAATEIWIDSGLDVRKGQKIRFAVTGRVNLSRTQSCGPEGIALKDPEKLIPDKPSGAVIAVIGDDNDEFIFIGPAAELVATRSGRLFLMVNDSKLDDNSGEFSVRVLHEESSSAQKQK
jgi:hypothetical protein